MARKPKRLYTFVPVQQYIDPYTSDLWWYYIPGFNGYEISNTGIVRSMKHFRKYPFGILIRPREVSNPLDLFTKSYDDLTYELSDNNNERQVIKRSTLLYLASSNPYHVQGYPRRTIVTDIAPRNLRCFIQKKIDTGTPLTESIHKVQFYYEKDTDVKISTGELVNMEKEKSHIIQPLIFDEPPINKKK